MLLKCEKLKSNSHEKNTSPLFHYALLYNKTKNELLPEMGSI